MHRWISVVLALGLAGSAAPAAAQFTAAVEPPKHAAVRPAPVPIAAQPESTKAAQPAAAAKTLSDMKVWVDSAATALAQATPAQSETTATVPPRAAVPSGAAKPGAQPKPRAQPKPAAPPTKVSESQGEIGNLRNGARAPATATPLPTLALLGIASLIAGALLRRRWSR